MSLTIITDLFDPDLGSEFQVCCKTLRSCRSTKRTALWTLKRGNNEQSIKDWLRRENLAEIVDLHLVPMRFSRSDGSHQTRLHFVADLIVLYCTALKFTGPDSQVWKSGQVNIVFNFLFLFFSRTKIVGPISGFELPDLRSMVLAKEFKLVMKYSLYSILIIVMRFLVRLNLRFRTSKMTVLVATDKDYSALLKAAESNSHVELERVSEVDIEGILKMVRYSKKTISTRYKILWAGALNGRKNPVLAAQIIRKTCKDSRFEAEFVGNGPLLEEVTQVLSQAPSVNLMDNVPRKDFIKKIESADAVLVTSWREANSVFVLEAIAAGCCVVAPDVSGLSESVGSTGHVLSSSKMRNVEVSADVLREAALSGRSQNRRDYLEDHLIRENSVLRGLARSNG